MEKKNTKGWIGCDLDGVLAHYEGWNNGVIGEPIPKMLERVKSWIKNGHTVKIMTARVANPESIPAIKEWLTKHGLGELEITNIKDMQMIALWDDRAVQVVPNSGLSLGEIADAMIKKLQAQVASLQREIGGAEKVKLYDNLGGEIK